MPQISYVPAEKSSWTVMVHSSTVLALATAPPREQLDAVWALLLEEAVPGKLLDELIRSGISGAPEFALIGGKTPAAMTVLVRGGAVVRASGVAGALEVSGEGVSSWVEQVVDATRGFELLTSSAAGNALPLPLLSGVVRASSFRSADFSESATAELEPPVRAAPVSSRKAAAALPPEDLEETLASQTVAASPEATVVAEELTVREAPALAADGSSYDHLFGETVLRKVEDAAVRGEPDEDVGSGAILVGPPPAADDGPPGDHDGHTVMVSDLAALRAKRKAARSIPAAVEVAPPSLYLELSTGGRELLDQPLVIGRAPSASRVPGGRVPRLVTMNTPNQDISRTHAQITADGGTVVVTDLHSSNGTMITLPGKPAQRLRPGEPSAVVVGTVIDLGDGATLTVCETS